MKSKQDHCAMVSSLSRPIIGSVRTLTVFGLLVLLCSWSLAANATNVVETARGYQRIQVTDVEFDSILGEEMRAADVNYPGISQKLAGKRTNEMVVVSTLRGVLQAGFPAWLDTEILESAGYKSWKDVSDKELDSPIAKQVISLDGLEMLREAALNIDPDGVSKGWFCSRRKDYRNKRIERAVSAGRQEIYNHDSDNVTANLEADFNGDGVFVADVYYIKHKRCGITYKITFRYADIDVDATLNGSIDVDGSVSFAYSDTLLQHRIDLWHSQYGFWLWLVHFDLDLDLGVDLGVTLDVTAQATLNAQFVSEGTFGLGWRCTSSGCDQGRKDVSFSVIDPTENNYAVEVKVVVTPYADANFEADLDIYFGLADMARGKLGVVASLPITYFGYYGNLCSDANDDGVNEFVEAQVLDAEFRVGAYLEWEVLGNEVVRALNLGLPDYIPSDSIDLNTQGSLDAIVYRRVLGSSGLSGGSPSIADPVINVPDVVRFDAGGIIVKRSCYPFADALVYEIDWGDGSPIEFSQEGLTPHTWTGYGDAIVRVRTVGDAMGRAVNSQWVSKRVNVSPDGQRPFYPWLSTVLSLMD